MFFCPIPYQLIYAAYQTQQRKPKTMKPEDIRDAMSQATAYAIDRVGRPRVGALLQNLGAMRVRDLDRSKWVDYLEAVQALQPPEPPPSPLTATIHVDYAIGARVETRVTKTQLKVVGYEVRYILERADNGREYALGDSVPSARLVPAAKVPEAPTPWAPPIKAPTDREWSQFANMFPDFYRDVENSLKAVRY